MLLHQQPRGFGAGVIRKASRAAHQRSVIFVAVCSEEFFPFRREIALAGQAREIVRIEPGGRFVNAIVNFFVVFGVVRGGMVSMAVVIRLILLASGCGSGAARFRVTAWPGRQSVRGLVIRLSLKCRFLLLLSLNL